MIVLALTARPASAGYIDGKFKQVGGGGYDYGTAQVTFTSPEPGAGESGTFYTGHYQFVRTGGTSTGTDLGSLFVQASGNSFWTFCIEINQSLNTTTTYNYEVKTLTAAPDPGKGVDFMTAGQANAVKELWGRFYSSVDSSDKAAAFQLALWEIVYDSPSNWDSDGGRASGSTVNFLSSGAVTSSSSQRTQANTWLNQLTGEGPKANLVALVSSTGQDQIIEVKAVPTPPSLVLAIVGFLPAFALRRRLLRPSN